ncbi:MAG: hypothetical protein K0R94_1656, partial [Burkholderiales bacterium]|nr:hypothetical protein [Burkholderiales bacterium]
MNNEYSSDVPPIKMGHKILIKDVTNISHSDIDVIINAVLTYGMCCIKGQKLEPKSLESLTMRFGEKITLPRYMTFDNYVDNYASVLRVSNIKKDGKIIENFTGAEYWHQDGDFNVGNRRRIWSFLYADIVPPAGGNTGFCDARRVLKILPKE